MENNQLTVIVENSGLEPTEGQTILEKFNSYEEVARDWENKAKAIVVTDISQVAEMKMAREGRLFLAQKRIDVEKARKALKEQSLRKGQAIDAIAKFLTSLIEPTEKYLKEQEDFVKIQAEKEADRLRIEAEAKAEVERLAKEKAEREEQERIRLENEKLRKEAFEREEAMRKEREEANRKIAEAEAEKRRIETELQQKKDAEEKAKRDADEAEKQKKEADEKAKQEEARKPELEKFNSYVETLLAVPTPDIEDVVLLKQIVGIRGALVVYLRK